MKFYKLLLCPRVAVCVALVFLQALAISGKPKSRINQANSAGDSAQVFNLADFAPVGDGVADDGPAFQRAVDAVAEAGGGTLFVPAGRYLIATPVVKDFSGSDGVSVTIQGEPSDTMPAAPTTDGDHLSRSLDLTSEIIPATGLVDSAFVFSNLRQLRVEHLCFTGRDTEVTDAYVTLKLFNITKATIYHCEFYGISTFGLVAGQGGGNIVRASRSDLSIEQTVFLGCAANSGAYAPIVENIEWKGFSIANSIFIDYGQRSFFSKLGIGAPLSWINIAGAAPRTPDSTRRQVVIRDTFFDEGGWIGITAYPHLWGFPVEPIDLIYISGLFVNVSNLGTAGHQFYDVGNVLIENSHYGWSHNTIAALDFHRTGNVILDRINCIDDADRIRADDRTDRLSIVNSNFGGLDSEAVTTNVLETAPDADPVQYVRQQFLAVLGRQPDPASHFYWSDLLVRCGTDQECLNVKKGELQKYLDRQPATDFSFAGTVVDEAGKPITGVNISLTGAQFANAVTDEQGKFHFSGLPTSGSYTVSASARHYTFANASQTVQQPAGDVNVTFAARLNRHSISGRISKADGTPAAGITVQLEQAPSVTVTTGADGSYSFANLGAGGDYTIVPLSDNAVFFPAKTTIFDLSADVSANYGMRLRPELLRIENSDRALMLTAVRFLAPPFSVFGSLSGNTRSVIIFSRNLEGFDDKSLYSVIADDDEGHTFPLEVEYVGDVPGQSWLKQVNIRLLPELSGKCVDVRFSAAGVSSNTARICLAED